MPKRPKEKNAAAQSLAAMRNKKLTPARRRSIARGAAKARWAKKPEPEPDAFRPGGSLDA